jgi:DNA-binding response OmpR family regulator
MDASSNNGNSPRRTCPGRFTRVSVQTPAGEIEARLSEMGNWELRVRRDEETSWRLACMGDVNGGAATSEPAVAAAEEPIRLGALRIEPAARRASVGETEVALSTKEFALLRVLAGQPSKVFSKSELLETVWGYSGSDRSRTLDSHASRLRVKLKEAGADGLVINCWGVGYRLWDRPAGEAGAEGGGAR